ncbi:hypothetical protein K439DRAFT_1613011 [Ramaria rubella]|nr:hypothetical protein K439DRAFT_1613011 [Ramaria rubella]
MSLFIESMPSTPVRGRSLDSCSLSPRTPTSTSINTGSPFSGRSFASSTLTSPSPVKQSQRFPFHAKSTTSIADLTDNWRERAQLNGIKVTAVDIDRSPVKDPLYYSPNRRQVAETHSSLARLGHFGSAFSTPPPKRNISQSFGSLTAPPEPRRRSVFDSPFPSIGSSSDESEALNTTPLTLIQTLEDPFALNNSAESIILCDLSSSCSVCKKEPSSSCRMIVLSPCSHIFCSSCFTGTLNIVGEKNMSCMDCNSSVDSFHFALGDIYTPSETKITSMLGRTFEPSTHPSETKTISSMPKPQELDAVAVLRIDNVPWDVTPLVIEKFINHPIIEAHVLLDTKGKTLSHAFVQLSLEDARGALRSSQNAILGRGRRARAVTVTLSSHEELMIALYPCWRGNFNGGAPSLDGLDNEQVNEALQHGLLSDTELNSLLALITNPNSHFLKVPLLPFYSLLSILSTFPSDVDSQIFWSCRLRDALFRQRMQMLLKASSMAILKTKFTHSSCVAAFQTLSAQIEELGEHSGLWGKLLKASYNCRAFTDSQIFKLEHLVRVNGFHGGPDQPIHSLKDNIIASDKYCSPINNTSNKLESLATQFGLQPSDIATIFQAAYPLT